LGDEDVGDAEEDSDGGDAAEDDVGSHGVTDGLKVVVWSSALRTIIQAIRMQTAEVRAIMMYATGFKIELRVRVRLSLLLRR
jgi:hypothetical protein